MLGISKPFTGQPGETVPEVVIVCPLRGGGIEGVITDAEGNPVPEVHVACWVLLDDGTFLGVPGTYADENGTFNNRKVRVGLYRQLLLAYRDGTTGQFSYIIVENVQVDEEAVTNLGTLSLKPISPEELKAILEEET